MSEIQIATPTTTPTRRRRSRDQRVKRLRREIIKVSPGLDDPKFAPLVGSFARASLLALDAYEFCRERGLVGDDGELRSSVDTIARMMGMQLKLARELGLSPAALGKFRGERPLDLVAALSRHVDGG